MTIDLHTAAKLALEAWQTSSYGQPSHQKVMVLAMTALRQALEQPAPVAKPHKQKPVAFLVDGDLYYPEEIDWETLQEQGHTVEPLYTRSQAREWVGLTDEEIDSMVEVTDLSGAYYYDDLYAVVRAAEAKLKEKNT